MRTLTEEQVGLYHSLATMDLVDGLSDEEYDACITVMDPQIIVALSSSGGAFPDISSTSPGGPNPNQDPPQANCGLDPSCSGC